MRTYEIGIDGEEIISEVVERFSTGDFIGDHNIDNKEAKKLALQTAKRLKAAYPNKTIFVCGFLHTSGTRTVQTLYKEVA